MMPLRRFTIHQPKSVSEAAETLAHYGKFYLVTSLWYDVFRAAGNAALVLTLGGPTLRVLERFRSRFAWEPWVEEPVRQPSV